MSKDEKYIDDILAEYRTQERAAREKITAEPAPVPVPAPVPAPAAVPPSPAGTSEAAGGGEGPSRPESLVWKTIRGGFGLVFAALGLLALAWMLLNVRPGATAAATAPLKMDLLGELKLFANNAASDALGELTYIPKAYAIPEAATVAPAPDPARFGSTEDPQEILALIDSAGALLDGQEAVFDPEANFQPGIPIRYYYDETILVIVWREIIEKRCCTFAEIKVQDGSQLRRKLATDTYGASTQLYASDMAKEANAVIALNGDFYAHRGQGITVYQRQVYRCKSDRLDTCFITASGQLLFSYAGELKSEEEAQRFVDENDVLFGLTFGPVLVDGGQLRSIDNYPLGEPNAWYSRTVLGTTGDKHYLLMTINIDAEAGCPLPSPLNQAAQIIYEKGVVQAYNLDGGQTSVMIMEGSPVNNVDWGTERTMSDIIYFATALPEKEGAA